MKRIISIALAALLTLSLGVVSASAASKYSKGQVIRVNLVASKSITNFTGLQGELGYGSNLSLVSGSFKAPSVPDMFCNVKKNPILFNGTSVSDYRLGSDKVVVTAKFKVLNDCDNLGITGKLEDIYTFSNSKFHTLSKDTTIQIITGKTKIKFTKSKAAVYVAGKAKLPVKISNAQGATSYKSSNTKIVKVNSKGVIKGVKKGTAVIKVKNNGISKKIKVNVKNPSLKSTPKTLKKGKTFTLKIKGQVGTAKFASSNTSVAKVSAKGVIKAIKAGKAKISIKTNGIKLSFKLEVV